MAIATHSWLTERNFNKFIFPLILFLLLIWLFSPTLKIPLLSDDYIWVSEVAASDNFGDFFKGTFALSDVDFRYRPLMPTGVRFCYQISGTNPFCMHLVSFTLHFLNTLLVGNLGYILTKNKWSAWAATLFFAVFFPHVVNVAWVSDLGNLLVVFFMLITITLFLQFLTRQNYLLWILSLVTFSLAMISKESALSLGPILVVWGGILYWRKVKSFNRRMIVLACSGYALLGAIYLLVINRVGLNFALSGTGNYAYSLDLNTLRNVVYYSLNLIWPTDVSVLELAYQNVFDISRAYTGSILDILLKILAVPGIFWVVGGTLVIWGGALWLLWRRQLVDWLTLTWIILGVMPIIFIAGHGERHMYVPSAGLSLLVGNLFFRGAKKFKGKVTNPKTFIYAMLFTVILVFNIYWTQVRVQNWQIAGRIARDIISTVTTRYPNLSAESELWFVNLPTDFNNAHLFRLGIEAALQLEINEPELVVHNLPSIDYLPNSLALNQYAFIFKEGQLIDLTPDYRSK